MRNDDLDLDLWEFYGYASRDDMEVNKYARKRASAYPSLEEQADMAYWDRKNGTTTLDDAIDAVKLQYPKG